MHASHRWHSGILTGLLLVSPAWAQGPPDSTWVRVGVAGGAKISKVTGSLLSVTPDSMVLLRSSDQGRMAIARPDVRTFERWAGTGSARGRYALRGLGIGAGVGLAGGALAAAAAEGCSRGSGGWNIDLSPGCYPTEWILGATAVGALVGTLVGGAIGANHRVDRWINAALPGQPAIVLRQRGLGLEFAVRLLQ